eukprot:CAMPEP_0174231726 /NCGR_PEP_ID=MMETSP0417-20130205/2190_1 /TAXON_ID=242541 /ORGANISM="Mayorella sp, Strain BSH-02190019" /LENGTH=225 /DNA_ID=CAMNT_0015309661 /DNA_START=125 /DNA_END=802 /DNA_ORIENTATION=-
MEAISHAGAVVGILAADGVVLGGEKAVTSPLLEKTSRCEKMYKIDEHICAAVAGITADANILVDQARVYAQRHTYGYGEPVPVEQLVKTICHQKQGYTQFGGLRPFGVSLLYAGWDTRYGFQLYHSDPSGNYAGWQAHAIGNKNQPAQSILKQEYKTDLTTEEAAKLAVKVLSKTLDSTTLSSEKLEFSTMTLVDGKPTMKVLTSAEVDALIGSVDVGPADDDNE